MKLKRILGKGGRFAAALTAMWLGVSTGRATVTITPASGGTGISADTAANTLTAAWTTLGAITITEQNGAGGRNDFSTGTNVTLVLKLPAGFEFNTPATPAISKTGSDITSVAYAFSNTTTIALILTVAGVAANDSLTIGNLQVRPTLRTPLASGQIHRPAVGGGTAVIEGLTTSTNANGSGGSNFGTLTEVAGTNNSPQVLILYDGAGASGWIGNLHAKLMANYLGHFNLPYVIKPVESYVSGNMNGALATFYFGMTFDNPLPAAFTNDVSTTTNTVCWFKYNMWQVSGNVFFPKPLDDRLGFRVVTLDGLNPDFSLNTNLLTGIAYKGESFDKFPLDPVLGLVEFVNTNIATAVVTAWRTNTVDASVYSTPYITRSSNFWYVGDSPFDFMNEEARHIIFADLLHDILNIDHPESHHALMRFEDVSPIYELPFLTNVAGFMKSENAPFAVSLIPYYKDPLGYYNGGVAEELRITEPEAAEFVTTIKGMITNGGQVLIHGYTHQYSNVYNPYNGVSGDDFEFFREAFQDGTNLSSIITYEPVPEDSAAWCQGRLNSAFADLATVNIPHVGWVTPHYSASATDSRVFATNFPVIINRVLYFADDYTPVNRHIAGQMFPFTIERDVYGQRLLPENIGNIEPEQWFDYPKRLPEDLIRTARKNLVIRDGWASGYFHPFYDLTNLTATVHGIKALGYTYVPALPTGKPVITFQPKTQTNLASGQPAKLSVAVIGSETLRYQWRFNGTNLVGATNAILKFPNLQPGHAGNYTAVITNTFGAVTSVVATLSLDASVTITNQPQSRTNLAGTVAAFTVGVSGTAPFAYQWKFYATNSIPGATNATLTLNDVQLTNAGNYTVVVTNLSGAVTSAVATLTVAIPTSITAHPQNQTNLAGTDATFSVTAGGTAPFGYQWRFNGADIAGANANELTVLNVQGTNAGNYDVVVTNNFGAVTSAVATLTVNIPVTITTQPQSRTNLLGTDAAFSVAAGGTAPFAYQWRFNGVDIAGANANELTVLNVQGTNAGNYDVVVTNNFGAVTSMVATLTVNIGVSITAQPQSRTNLMGTDAAFSVTAGGTAPFAYQWRFNGVDIAGANANALTVLNVQGTNAGSYDVVVTNNFGAVTSTVATLTVNIGVAITAQPQSRTNLMGTDAAFTVTAGGTAPFAYQWRFNGSAIAGATTNALTVLNVQGTNAGNYDVVVTNNFGAVTSAVATLTVNIPVTITAQPQSRTNLAGTDATFSVTAAGTAPLAYQWRFNGVPIAGANTNSLTLLNVQGTNAGNYEVVVTNNFGAVTSTVATLTVNVPVSITAQPQSLTNLAGADATFSVTVGGTAPFGYQWRFNGVPIAGANSNSLTVLHAQGTNAGNYDVVVNNNYGVVASSVATLTVNVPVSITAQPQSRTNLAGTDATFSVMAGGTAPFAYQWRFNGVDIAGANTNSFTVVNAQNTNAGGYDVVITNNFGAVTSMVATLTVNIGVSITTQPQSRTNLIGTDAAFSVTAGGTAPFAYQWRFNGADIAGANTDSITVVNAQGTNAGNYDVVVTNNFGAVTSAVATLTVNIGVSITAQPQSRTNLIGTDAAFSVTAGGTAPFAYQWRFNGVNIAGANTNELTVLNVQGTNAGDYDVVVTNNFGAVTSTVATLTVNIPVTITTQPQSRTNLAGTDAAFNVAADGTAPFAYQWRFNGVDIAGANTNELTVLNVQGTNAGGYDVVITNNFGAVTSTVAALTVVTPPQITTQPQSLTNVVGTTATFTVTAGGTGPLSYQWRFNDNDLSGAITNSLDVPNVQGTNAGGYAVVVANNYGAVTSVVATLSVTALSPVINIARGPGANVGSLFFNTAGGLGYYLEYRNELDTNVWQQLTNLTGNGGPMTVEIPTVTPSHRLYRLRVQ